MRKKILAGLFVLSLILGLLCGCQPAGLSDTEPSLNMRDESAVTTEATEPPTTEPPTEPPLPDPEFPLSATHVFVYDCGKERLLFHKGGLEDQIPMASITKLFTCFVALEYMSGDTVITAGDEVTMIDPDSSTAYVRPGHQLTVDMMVQALMLPSGNDAAYALAVAAGRTIRGDSQLSAQTALSAFVGEMNAFALELWPDSHFANPDGIDAPGHYTTLNDLITVCRQAMANETIRKYASMATADVTYASGETNHWKNSNLMLHESSAYYCEAACGLKTGSTNGAGKCLVSAFETEDGYLLIGVLGGQEDKARYEDTLRLYSYYTGVPVTLPGDQQPAETTAPAA